LRANQIGIIAYFVERKKSKLTNRQQTLINAYKRLKSVILI